jgi:hypothetical protein
MGYNSEDVDTISRQYTEVRDRNHSALEQEMTNALDVFTKVSH